MEADNIPYSAQPQHLDSPPEFLGNVELSVLEDSCKITIGINVDKKFLNIFVWG
jgi:hypothetical protein